MAVIHVLDKHTAELIAAGEVVERPASVVKELLENAIDAGATQVSVAIEKGGVSLIQVTDNGSGIEAEYISTAFIRHATSKISCEQDLESIHTLGFRGEALASIASVARVEVLTRTEPDEFACRYRIEGGEEHGMEPAARPVGTTITVRDLFYNTPARMKFLKKDASEGAFVGETVSRIALLIRKCPSPLSVKASSFTKRRATAASRARPTPCWAVTSPRTSCPWRTPAAATVCPALSLRPGHAGPAAACSSSSSTGASSRTAP